MSEMSKMVFVAFTQHCIQSTDFMLETSEILYSVYSGPLPHQEERLLCEHSILWVYLFTTMQSEEAALLTFLDLSNYKGDWRQDTQPIPNS